MHGAGRVTLVHHDNTATDFDDVRYIITAAGLRVLHADGTETTQPSRDDRSSTADTTRRPEATS